MTTTANCIQILTAAYPHSPFPPETIKWYIMNLEDIDPELLLLAIRHIGTTQPDIKFAPNPAQIRAAVAEIMVMDSGLPLPSEAWGMAMDAIRDADYFSVPDFEHGAIARSIKAIGGWRAIGMSTNTVADRARFDMAYKQEVERGKKEIVTLPQIKEAAKLMAMDSKKEIGAGDE